MGGGAPLAYIYNFTTTAIRDTAKSVLENYTDAEGENPIWKVLDWEGMNGTSDHYPSEGQPFGLYDELMTEQGIGGLFPEMTVFTHARYQVPFYSDSWMATGKTFMSERTSPIWWEEGNLTVLVGNHGTYDEQLIPLILHGPGIKQGYFSDTRVEALDIIPTICEFNGWKNPAWPGDGYFEDHEAEGDVLSDCLEPKTVQNQNKGTWYYTIQEAINDADSGHTIKAYSGIYNEHLIINKHINLIGETKGIPDSRNWGYSGQTSILDGDGTGTVINITADDVYIEGFEVRNGDIGIHINQTDSVTIAYNTISNHNVKGLFIDHATYTEISHTRIINNLNIGSHAYYSTGKGFYYNEIGWNNVGLKYEQSSVSECSNRNWYHDNTIGIDYDPIEELPPLLIDSNVLENNTAAINITGGSNITLSNNSIFNNEYGISIFNSNNISIIDNDIYDNTFHGIYIDLGSHNNTIYHNNLQNTFNAYDYGTNNHWDNDLEGNWWSNNPNPTDANGDGICDEPYSGTTFTDDYPLANEDNDRVHVGSVSLWFIQSAINLAKENDIIYIDIGDYMESVTVGKTLTAIGDMIILHGDLTIPTGSVLTLQDSDLVMGSSYDGELTIIVDGTLHLINSNIYSIDPQFRYNIIGQGNIIIENSDIRNVHPSSIFGFSENLIYYGDPSLPYDTLVLQFPAGGDAILAYIKLPKTTDIFYAQLDLTGAPIGPNYPTNPSIDVGNDGIIEWSYINQLKTTETVTDLNTNPIFAISVQDYIDVNQPDENGFINIPVLFSSQSEGELIISNIDLGYTEKWVSAIFSKDHIFPICYLNKFTVDIYYTGLGGIRIDDNLCPEIDYINTISEENWQRPATIKHYYFDVDNNGIVDGTSIPESTLKMYWWDESIQGWVPTTDVFGEENTGVNTVDNYVWTNVDCFSNFTTKGSYVPIVETEDLIDTLDEMDIEDGIKNSLRVKLEAALGYLNAAWDNFVNGDLALGNENLTLAKNKFNDFINEVEAQRGKAISGEDADILINNAQEIIDLIDEAYV
ncbi:MAG: NosD domain-containing protein [Thermoplasmata archaeon]